MNNETLKRDLCARLPYGLKILRPDKETILELKGVLGDLLQFQEYGKPFETFGSIKAGTNLPILFQTSALTKEIQIATYNDGKPFVPIEEMRRLGIHDHLDFISVEADGLIRNRGLNGWFGEIPFKIIELLQKWHINYRLSPDQFIEVTDEFNPYK